MATDVTPLPPQLLRALADMATAVGRMAEALSAAMTKAAPKIAAFTVCLPRVTYRIERRVDRARRQRIECWMRRRDRRAARRARR